VTQTINNLKKIIKDINPIYDHVKSSSDLTNDLRFDSIAFMILLTNIEKKFNVSFTLKDLQSLEDHKLENFANLIDKKLK
tara:strand:+ start:194 stop:433 length:240 start_codon:yes stop_codon:yes gene_type:complete